MAASTTVTNVKNTQPAKGYTVNSDKIGPTSTSGDTIVAAVAGKVIKVIGYEITANAANNVKFMSDANEIGGSPTFYLNQYSVVNRPVSLINNQPIVYFQTNAGEALKINLSAVQLVGGSILYVVE